MSTRGTEIKNKKHGNLNVIYGTIDKANPKSLYIKITGWGNTKYYSEERDYASIIKKLNKRISRLIFTDLDCDLFKREKTMVDFDMRDSGITYDKSSFMSCEITLYQQKTLLMSDEVLLESLDYLTKNIIENILNNNEFFDFFKNKKQANSKLKEPIL